MERVKARIDQRKALLIPDDKDPELWAAYDTLSSFYAGADPEELSATDLPYLVEIGTYTAYDGMEQAVAVIEHQLGEDLSEDGYTLLNDAAAQLDGGQRSRLQRRIRKARRPGLQDYAARLQDRAADVVERLRQRSGSEESVDWMDQPVSPERD